MSEENKDLGDEIKDTAKEFAESAKQTVKNEDNKKILAGILAIILGSLGVHKFILGYQKEGFILLGATVVGYATLCIGIGAIFLTATGLIGLIEGIIYLTKSDEDFFNTYQSGSKPWF
jgi:TM2 domain-containing membrane protein YozV